MRIAGGRGVIIPNEFIDNYGVLSDTSVKIYLMMKAYGSLEDITEWTQDDIVRVCKIDQASFESNIVELINMGYVVFKDYAPLSNIYYINERYNTSLNVTEFGHFSLIQMVDKSCAPDAILSDGEIKLYTYLYKMADSNNSNYSREEIAKNIGKTVDVVSELIESLINKKYIRKEEHTEPYFHECRYCLLR